MGLAHGTVTAEVTAITSQGHTILYHTEAGKATPQRAALSRLPGFAHPCLKGPGISPFDSIPLAFVGARAQLCSLCFDLDVLCSVSEVDCGKKVGSLASGET